MSPPAKGLGLLSGGLDSILAALVLRRAGVEVSTISFSSPFFGAQAARRAASVHEIPLTVLEVGPEHLEQVVKHPRHGYGSNMNPCLDCHAYMLNRAGAVMEEQGLDFLFTGEVLGQRPMSQNRQALGVVAQSSGYGPRVLRPLSAKLLPPTVMEEEGLVDREQLLDLSGRSRKPQMALARELGVEDYPSPAGGCLLTEPGFSRRLKDLLTHDPGAGVAEVELLKYGRVFRISPAARLSVGRNQADNQSMERVAPDSAVRITAADHPGPLGLYFGPLHGENLEKACALVAGYGKAGGDQEVTMLVSGLPLQRVRPLSRRLAHGMLV